MLSFMLIAIPCTTVPRHSWLHTTSLPLRSSRPIVTRDTAEIIIIVIIIIIIIIIITSGHVSGRGSGKSTEDRSYWGRGGRRGGQGIRTNVPRCPSSERVGCDPKAVQTEASVDRGDRGIQSRRTHRFCMMRSCIRA